MKKQTFWKLKLAIVCLILPATLFVNEKMSASCISMAKDNIYFGDFSEENNIGGDFESDEDEIFALVNIERERNNLKVLVWDNQLAEIARNYSRQMARENFFDHFDSQGADVVVRAKNARLKHWSKIGENLFSVKNLTFFGDFAVKKWMNSPTHRENILDADFNTGGIGIAESDTGEIFITQVFVRR